MFRLAPWDLDRLTPSELYDVAAAIEEIEEDSSNG